MAVRPIVIWPDDRLRAETQPIGEITDEVRQLFRDLTDTMYASNGLGIAAPQIGVALKMFLVEPALAGKSADDPPVCLINPEILEVSDDKQKGDEGCLSFPGIYVQVERPLRTRVRAMNLDGEMFDIEGDELLARCLLHENDHLSGQLLVDFVGPLKKRMIKRRLEREAAATADAG